VESRQGDLGRRARHLRQLRDPRPRAWLEHAVRTPLAHRRARGRNGREGPGARAIGPDRSRRRRSPAFRHPAARRVRRSGGMVGREVGTRPRRGAAGGRAQVGLRAALLAWYRAERRDLPWRRSRDPYAIWISETMLQQTRVEAVIPYYERFLARFPTVGTLATADLDDVLSVWAGLGYYSRARNRKRAAEQIVADHGGALPADPDALQELPGIGRY